MLKRRTEMVRRRCLGRQRRQPSKGGLSSKVETIGPEGIEGIKE